MLFLVAVPFGIFVVAGRGTSPGDVAIVRAAMRSQIGSGACAQAGGIVRCEVAGGAVCRYRIFTGTAAAHVYNGVRSPPADVRFAVLGRCRLHGHPDGGTVGYITSSSA